MTDNVESPQSDNTPVFTPLGGDIGNLAGEHMSSMSPPSEHAIAAEKEDNEKLSGLVDKSGTPFDAEQHATDDEGQPLKTAAGNWRKRPGRKKGDGPRSTLNTKNNGSATKQETGQSEASYVSAVATVDSMGMLAQMLGGNEYQYKRVLGEDGKTVLVDERENGVQAFTAYYEQKGVTDIPPGLAITIWAMMYIAPRLSQDKRAHNKFKMAWHWFLSKITRKKVKAKANDKSEKEKDG